MTTIDVRTRTLHLVDIENLLGDPRADAHEVERVLDRCLAHAAPEFVERRAGRLVIGSGDHAFIPRALAARSLGVGVLVVARTRSTCSGWYAHGFPVVSIDEAVVSLAA